MIKISKKRLLIVGTLTVLTVAISGCAKNLENIKNSPEYQKTKQTISSGVDFVGEKAKHLIENNETTKDWADKAQEESQKFLSGAKDEANKLFDQGKQKLDTEVEKIKESSKQKIKSGVNAKIDKSFKNF